MSPAAPSTDGSAPGRGRSGPARRHVARMRRESRRSGATTAQAALGWQIALDLAQLVDVARVNGNQRDYLAACKQLEHQLDRLGEVTGPDRDRDGSKPAERDPYGDPPEVGDTANA